jgi:hypothetical protein
MFATSYSSTVCTSCGIEKQVGLIQEPTYNHSSPLDRSYSRPDRWKGLIRKLTGYHNGPGTHDPIWAYLKTHAPYTGPQDIIFKLRKSKLLNKHYQSTFIFTKIFSDMELPIQNELVCKQLLSYFGFIYQLWNRNNIGKPFFSYNWLIEQALWFFNYVEYIPFVKKLVCEKRRRKYKTQLFKLYGTHLGHASCMQSATHSEYVKSNSCCLRSQFGGVPCPSSAKLDQCMWDLLLCPECKSTALLGVVRMCSSYNS